MKALLLVGLGGFGGSALRYLFGIWLLRLSTAWALPVGTFAVNILGSFLIGLLYGLSAKDDYLTPSFRLLLITGFCGGFTTFSTFSYENLSLLQQGQTLQFSLYALGSLLTGLAAVALGLFLVKSL